MEETSDLTKLAELITSSLTILQKEWKRLNVVEPSFSPDAEDNSFLLSVDATQASRTLVGAAKVLSTLVCGPMESATRQVQMVVKMNL